MNGPIPFAMQHKRTASSTQRRQLRKKLLQASSAQQLVAAQVPGKVTFDGIDLSRQCNRCNSIHEVPIASKLLPELQPVATLTSKRNEFNHFGGKSKRKTEGELMVCYQSLRRKSNRSTVAFLQKNRSVFQTNGKQNCGA